MGRPWNQPTHRSCDDLQLEICELCGGYRAAKDLIEGTAQGLIGRRICPEHVELATNPSHRDLRISGDSQMPQKEPLEPHSPAGNWGFEDW